MGTRARVEREQVQVPQVSDVSEVARLAPAALRALALQGSGDARIVALECLAAVASAPSAKESDENFRTVFLSPRVWNDPDEHVRWLAVKAVGEGTPDAFAEPLVQALSDPSWLVREHAALACTRALARVREAGAALLSRRAATWLEEPLARVLVFARAPLSEIKRAAESVVVDWVARDPRGTVPALLERAEAGASLEARALLAGLCHGLGTYLEGLLDTVHRAFETQEAAWFERVLAFAARLGDARVNLAAAAALRGVAQAAARATPSPSCRAALSPALLSAMVRFLSDPNPSIAEALLPALGEPAVLTALLADATPGALSDVALARLVHAAARVPWGNAAALPESLWSSAADLAFACAGARDFRVRRAARALLGALGPLLVPSLVAFAASEHECVPFDAGLARRLAAPLEPWLFRPVCRQVGAQGGQACAAFLERALSTETDPRRAVPAGAALEALRARFFALRSVLVVLWNQPERDAEAGAPVREILARFVGHATPSLHEAASYGR